MLNPDFPPKRRASTDDVEHGAPATGASEDLRGLPTFNESISDKEMREELKLTVEEIKALNAQKLAEKAGVSGERDVLATTTGARRDALKAYLHAEADFKKIKEPTAEETAAFEAERAKFGLVNADFTAAQLAYAKPLQESVRQRLQEKGWSQEHIDKVLVRYGKSVRTRELFMPRIKQEQAVREEVLDERGRNLWQSLTKWSRVANERLEGGVKDFIKRTRFGKGIGDVKLQRRARNTARAIRLVSFGALGMTIGSGFAAAAVGARGISLVLGAGGGFLYGKHFAETKGKKRAEHFEEMQLKNIESAEDLQAQEQAFQTGSEEAIDRGRATRENIVSLVTGLGVSFGTVATNALSLESIKNAWHAITNEFGISEAHAAPGDIPASVPTPPEAIPHAEIGPTMAGATIHIEGQGTDQLFFDMKDEIREQLGQDFLNDAQPALRHFMETHPNALSREMGEAFGENGIRTQMGDQFFVDENQNVVYQSVDGEPQIFIENDQNAPNGYRVNPIDAEPLRPVADASESAQADQPPVRTSESAGTTSNASEVAVESDARGHAPQHNPAVTSPDALASPVAEAVSSPRTAPVTGNAADLDGTPLQSYPSDGSVISSVPENNSEGSVPRGAPPVPGELDGTPLSSHGSQNSVGESAVSAPSADISAEAQPLSLTPGQSLPEGKSLFSLAENPRFASGDGGRIFFANAETPEESLALAYEHGRKNPGTKIFFDNTEHSLLRGTTHRVGSLVVDGRTGNIKNFEDLVHDRNGEPLRTMDTNLLSERIRIA